MVRRVRRVVRRVRRPWWVGVLLATFGCNFSTITEQVLCGVVSFDGPLQSCSASGGRMHVATLNAFPHTALSFRWPPAMGCMRLHQAIHRPVEPGRQQHGGFVKVHGKAPAPKK